MRTQHRIAAAVRMRLEMLKPYIVSWAQALSLQARASEKLLPVQHVFLVLIIATSVQAQPQNAVAALRQRAALVDEIWHAAGACARRLRVGCQQT